MWNEKGIKKIKLDLAILRERFQQQVGIFEFWSQEWEKNMKRNKGKKPKFTNKLCCLFVSFVVNNFVHFIYFSLEMAKRWVSSNSTHAEELWGKCAKLLHTANTQINIKFQARKIIIIFFIDLNVEEYVWTMKQLKRSSNEKKEISTKFRFTFRMKIYHYQILNGLLWNDYCLEWWFIGID